MSLRTEKVEATLQKTAAEILQQNLSLRNTTVTITKAQVSPDLKHATLWISIYGQQADIAKDQIIPLRQELSRSIALSSTTKFSPKLDFRFDNSAEYADKINRLIQDI